MQALSWTGAAGMGEAMQHTVHGGSRCTGGASGRYRQWGGSRLRLLCRGASHDECVAIAFVYSDIGDVMKSGHGIGPWTGRLCELPIVRRL